MEPLDMPDDASQKPKHEKFDTLIKLGLLDEKYRPPKEEEEEVIEPPPVQSP